MERITLFADSAGNIIGNSARKACTSNCGPLSSQATLTNTVGSVVNLLLYLAGALAIIFIVIGGLKYVLSEGNPANIQSAKNTLLYAIVGLVIAVSAFAIVNFVLGRL
jgi:hypothetical protein